MPTSMFPPTDEFWSSDPSTSLTTSLEKGLGLATTIGLLGGGVYAAKNTRIGTHTLLDHIQNTVRRAGYASPFALLNTFRGAEALSPFVTTGSLGLATKRSIVDPSKEVVQYVFESAFLKGDATKETLAKIFPDIEKIGLDDIRYNLSLQENKIDLVFEADPRSNTGSLYMRHVDDKIAPKIISKNVSLFETLPGEVGNQKWVSESKKNPFFKAILQASGLVDQWGKDADKNVDEIFKHSGEGLAKGEQRPTKRMFPIPTPDKSVAGASLYARAFPAFGMERLNRLLLGTVEQIPVLGTFTNQIDKAFGFDFKVQSGTASKMFARFGTRAAAIGGIYLGIEQLDHYRRNFGLPGDIAVSGITSLGIAGLSKKIGGKNLSSRAAAAIGVGSFVGQMVLPGFGQGIFPGIATTFKNIDIATTALGEITLMNSYRRTVEGLMPGVSGMGVGVIAGLGLALASGAGTDPISSKIFRRLNLEQKQKLFGANSNLANPSVTELPQTAKSLKLESIHRMTQGDFLTDEAKLLFGTEFPKRNLGFSVSPTTKTPGFLERRKVMSRIFSAAVDIGGADAVNALEKELFARDQEALSTRKNIYTSESIVNKSYLAQIDEIQGRVSRGEISKATGVFESIKSKVTHAFFGASFQGDTFIEGAKNLGIRDRVGRYGAVFGLGFLAHQLITGGLFGSMETASEKAAIYSGEQLVAVRRGRFWEGGGTPFEGRDVMYHRPHAYVQYMNRTNQKSLYGEDEDKISPIKKFFIQNFTYDLERQNYFTRPYPITAGAFENIPVIGNILASTIGQLIKPTKLMHVNEFMRVGPDGEVQYKTQNEIDRPAYNLGGMSHGAPVSPFSAGQVVTNLQYQFRELEGLTGWAKNILTKMSTGQETFGLDSPVLQSAGAMTSINKQFWDMELGGGLFLSEPIRRFLPKQRSEIMEYNPIPNQMPTWLPERFHQGDPYRVVKSGNVRLPGPGYEALHPELKGLGPNAYPDIYKYKILADVAPTSREFTQLRQRMYKRRASGTLSEKEAMMMDQADRLLASQMQGYAPPQNQNAYNIPIVSGLTQGIYGGAVNIAKDAINPFEYMIPMGFRPTQKLLPYDNAIDQYEYQRLYGTQFSFWDKPIRDWFRPAFYTAAHAMGYDGVPGYRKKANEVNEHFDKLEFYKNMQLAQQAEMAGDTQGKNRFLAAANRTRYGINPQSSAMAIYQTLPDGEKEFFDAFAAAQGKDRQRILEMVPADQKVLYQNLWSRIDRGDPTVYPGSERQVSEEHLNQKFYGLQTYFDNRALPEADWVGWHENVDLDDIKVRYVSELGMDLYDVDMYNSKLRAQARRNYLNGAEQDLFTGGGYISPGRGHGLRSAVRGVVNQHDNGSHAITNINLFEFGSENRGYFQYNDDRRYEMIRMMQNAYE